MPLARRRAERNPVAGRVLHQPEGRGHGRDQLRARGAAVRPERDLQRHPDLQPAVGRGRRPTSGDARPGRFRQPLWRLRERLGAAGAIVARRQPGRPGNEHRPGFRHPDLIDVGLQPRGRQRQREHRFLRPGRLPGLLLQLPPTDGVGGARLFGRGDHRGDPPGLQGRRSGRLGHRRLLQRRYAGGHAGELSARLQALVGHLERLPGRGVRRSGLRLPSQRGLHRPGGLR